MKTLNVTYLEMLKHRFPYISLDEDGIPEYCPFYYGFPSGLFELSECKDCVECWNKKVPWYFKEKQLSL